MSLGLHTGTHVDAPRHFVEGGAGADALPLEVLCGPAGLVRSRDPHAVQVPELETAQLDGAIRGLF